MRKRFDDLHERTLKHGVPQIDGGRFVCLRVVAGCPVARWRSFSPFCGKGSPLNSTNQESNMPFFPMATGHLRLLFLAKRRFGSGRVGRQCRARSSHCRRLVASASNYRSGNPGRVESFRKTYYLSSVSDFTRGLVAV